MDDSGKCWDWLLHWVLEDRESYAYWGMWFSWCSVFVSSFFLHVGFKLGTLCCCGRWIDPEVFLFSGSGTGSHTQAIRPRNMMTLQWNIFLMCCFFWSYVSLYIHWSMNATRVGIHGYCHHAPVVYILLVCYWQWVIKFQIVGKLWSWCMIYLFQVSLWCVHSCSLIISWNQLHICHGDRWLTNFWTQS